MSEIEPLEDVLSRIELSLGGSEKKSLEAAVIGHFSFLPILSWPPCNDIPFWRGLYPTGRLPTVEISVLLD